MSNFLLTGGAGFIGSHLIEALLASGHSVRVVDNFLTGRAENIQPFLPKIDFLEGDIRNLETCAKATKGMDFVLHHAAISSPKRSIQDPILTYDINVTGTLNVLIASRDTRAKKLLFASSSSVYGDDARLPQKEGREGNPLTPYGISKLAGEKYCQLFTQLYGFPTVCLRYFNVFGQRQYSDTEYAAVIPSFISRIAKGMNPIIHGDGEQTRDFTFIDNVVKANLAAILSENNAGEIINIGGGNRVTINMLADFINKQLKQEIPPLYEEPRLGDIRHSHADISKAKELLNYDHLISYRTGLKKTIEWHVNDKERSI